MIKSDSNSPSLNTDDYDTFNCVYDDILIENDTEFQNSSYSEENLSYIYEKYFDKMVKNQKKHSKGFKYFIFCHVILKKDFDKNFKAKNRGLDTKHHSDIYQVIEIEGNLLKIKDKKGGISETNIHLVSLFFKY